MNDLTVSYPPIHLELVTQLLGIRIYADTLDKDKVVALRLMIARMTAYYEGELITGKYE